MLFLADNIVFRLVQRLDEAYSLYVEGATFLALGGNAFLCNEFLCIDRLRQKVGVLALESDFKLRMSVIVKLHQI